MYCTTNSGFCKSHGWMNIAQKYHYNGKAICHTTMKHFSGSWINMAWKYRNTEKQYIGRPVAVSMSTVWMNISQKYCSNNNISYTAILVRNIAIIIPNNISSKTWSVSMIRVTLMNEYLLRNIAVRIKMRK